LEGEPGLRKGGKRKESDRENHLVDGDFRLHLPLGDPKANEASPSSRKEGRKEKGWT